VVSGGGAGRRAGWRHGRDRRRRVEPAPPSAFKLRERAIRVRQLLAARLHLCRARVGERARLDRRAGRRGGRRTAARRAAVARGRHHQHLADASTFGFDDVVPRGQLAIVEAVLQRDADQVSPRFTVCVGSGFSTGAAAPRPGTARGGGGRSTTGAGACARRSRGEARSSDGAATSCEPREQRARSARRRARLDESLLGAVHV
jgi:hypothetical protein